MILLKIYASVLALTFAAGVAQMGYGMATDDLRTAERGLGFIAGSLGGVILGGLAVFTCLVWAS